MKRWLFILLLFAASSLCAEEGTVYEPPFSPRSAEVMAQGGSFNANAQGFYALFSNPAAYAGETSSLTVFSGMPWVYAFPPPALTESLSALGQNPVSAGWSDLLTGPGGGAGASLGVGYVGNGLGLGLIGTAESFAWGPNTLGISVDSNITVGFIGGLALPIRIGGLTMKIGGAFRPMYRIHVPGLGINAFMSMLSGDSGEGEINVTAYHGVGLALDAGILAEYGPLAAGVALRDLFGTPFQYSTSTVTALIEALKAGSLPEGGELVSGETRYVIPMTAHFGVAFHPRLGGLSAIVDPIVHADWEVPFLSGERAVSFWTSIHAGAEVSLFSMLKLRAGINQGYLTAGIGFHLLFVDLNVAYFGRELGSFAGSRENQGVTAELAFRF